MTFYTNKGMKKMRNKTLKLNISIPKKSIWTIQEFILIRKLMKNLQEQNKV